jgi:hypothetical protein
MFVLKVHFSTEFLHFLAPGSGFPIRIRIHKVTLNPDPIRIRIHNPDLLLTYYQHGSHWINFNYFYFIYLTGSKRIGEHNLPKTGDRARTTGIVLGGEYQPVWNLQSTCTLVNTVHDTLYTAGYVMNTGQCFEWYFTIFPWPSIHI